MMTREELEEALDFFYEETGEFTEIIKDAARKHLALMPEKCGTCEGWGFIVTSVLMGGQAGYAGPTCEACHGSGKVYPLETVDKIAQAIGDCSDFENLAVAVLDALGEHPRVKEISERPYPTPWGPDHPSYDEMGQ